MIFPGAAGPGLARRGRAGLGAARQGKAWLGKAWGRRARKEKKTMSVFRGGVPTGPDVERLMKAFPAKPGDRIAAGAIAAVLGLDPQSPRFRTVTGKWRAKLHREQGLRLTLAGKVFHVLTAPEQVNEVVHDINRVTRAAARAYVEANIIDVAALSDTEKRQHYLVCREIKAIAEETKRAQIEVAGPKPLQSSMRLVKQ
jgi:hypothetical protein